jgi:hypothetical protein
MSNAMFLENFQTLVSVVEDYGGTIGTDPKGAKAELIKEGIDVDNASDASKQNAMETAKNRYMAMAMLTAADVARYSRLLEDLDNDYTKGNNNYPHTVTEAYNLIINYRQARPAARIYHNAEGVAFTNIEEEGDERPPRTGATSDVSTAKPRGITRTSVLTWSKRMEQGPGQPPRKRCPPKK